jgi:hypothetical protein
MTVIDSFHCVQRSNKPKSTRSTLIVFPPLVLSFLPFLNKFLQMLRTILSCKFSSLFEQIFTNVKKILSCKNFPPFLKMFFLQMLKTILSCLWRFYIHRHRKIFRIKFCIICAGDFYKTLALNLKCFFFLLWTWKQNFYDFPP